MADYTNDIPEGAIVANVLHIVEYVDVEGDIWKVDLSHDSTFEGDLGVDDYYRLTEWAKMHAQAPIIAEMVHDYVYGGDDDDDEDGVTV